MGGNQSMPVCLCTCRRRQLNHVFFLRDYAKTILSGKTSIKVCTWFSPWSMGRKSLSVWSSITTPRFTWRHSSISHERISIPRYYCFLVQEALFLWTKKNDFRSCHNSLIFRLKFLDRCVCVNQMGIQSLVIKKSTRVHKLVSNTEIDYFF